MARILKIVGTCLLFSMIFSSCNNNSGKIIIVTGTPAIDPLTPSLDQKIAILNPTRPTGIKILTDDFYSASSPDISSDAKSMIFSGRKTQQDPWQIWEMNLGSKKVRQITSCTENCLYPAYLPDGRLVFSRMLLNDSLKSRLALFRCNKDGSKSERITFNPVAWYASTILSDGRILAKCAREFPKPGQPQFMVLRPDGTKAELFYNNKGVLTGGKALETSEGRIIFTERHGNESGVVSVPYNNPFGVITKLSGTTIGDFITVSNGTGNKLLTCYRSSPSEKYRLMEFSPGNNPGDLLYEDKNYDVVEAYVIKSRVNPRRLPSEVDNLVKTGLVLCQDINREGAGSNDHAKPASIEIIGINASYGIINPESDGSFYLKVIADTPFRFVTRDEKGKVIKICEWMSLRPNERRGCTGCHEEPGIVPENRLPLAIKKDPVPIPVHITRIDEKTVELE